MTETVTGKFDSLLKIRNAQEDLIATGIPQEKIFVDEGSNELKVLIPAASKSEIVEILSRHNPMRVT